VSAVIVAIGDNRTRAKIFEKVRELGALTPVFIHPSAIVASSAELGEGAVVMARCVVGPNVRIGRNVCLNTASVVEHDCVIEDHAHIFPGATVTGSVRIGAATSLGANSTVIPQVAIGADVTVGAGAVVIRDVADGLTVAGVPAQPLTRSFGERQEPYG